MSKAFDPQEIVTEYARTLIRVKAKQIVRRPGFSRSDQADVEQDLVVHLLCQAEHFDPERASLNTFIARVIDSAVAMLVRERGRVKRRPRGDAEVQSLADKVPQPDGPPEALARLISQLDLERRTGGASLPDTQLFELADDVASVIPTLPPELQEVCRSLLNRNRSETEAALGLSRRRLAAAMAVIREHFEKTGLTKT
jgi:RNA polymerase sigma factor (sigma-70 family)